MSCIYIYNIGHLSFIVSITISYVSYCKVKPQWVIQPRSRFYAFGRSLGKGGLVGSHEGKGRIHYIDL